LASAFEQKAGYGLRLVNANLTLRQRHYSSVFKAKKKHFKADKLK
jgi:hypothetical protein